MSERLGFAVPLTLNRKRIISQNTLFHSRDAHARRYVVFNRVPRQEDNDGDPPLPLDAAPAGVPTLSDWKKTEGHRVNPATGQVFSEGERLFVRRRASVV